MALAWLFLLLVFVGGGSGEKNRIVRQRMDGDGVLVLDSTSFQILTTTPLDYTLVVLFNALSPQFDCLDCVRADREFRVLARKYMDLGGDSRIYFATINFFDNNAEVFRADKRIKSVPFLMIYNLDKNTPERSFPRLNLDELELAIARHLGISRPDSFNWARLMVWIMTAAVALGLGILFRDRLARMVCGNALWRMVSIVFVCLATSGTIWNYIRKPPLLNIRNGRIQWIIPQFQTQYGIEASLIALAYMVCSVSVVLLTIHPRLVKSAQLQRITIVTSLGFFVLFYSISLAMCRAKGSGYPFSLLF